MAVRELEAGKAPLKIQAITFLADSSEEKDLPTHQAEVVAWYVGTANLNEYKFIKPLLKKLGRFRSVLIAMADLTDEQAISSNRLQDVIADMAGSTLKLAGEENWRGKSKAVLMQKAMTMERPAYEGDGVQLILRDLYRYQAQWFGVAVPQDEKQVSVFLEKLVTNLADQLEKRPNLPAADKQFVERIKDQLKVADYLTSNDLQKTVALQRIWLRLLAIDLARKAPSRGMAAQQLVDDLLDECRRESNVVEQLWTSERYLLRMWMLRLNRPVALASN